ARDRAILRLTPILHNVPSLNRLGVQDEEIDESVSEAIKSLRADEERKPEAEHRDWLVRATRSLERKSNRALKAHPLGGFVVVGKKRLHQFDPTFVEAEESWESATDVPYPLAVHGDDVARLAHEFAERCGLSQAQVEVLRLAGHMHDAGKADPRFQAWLHGGNRRKAEFFPQLLAKSFGPVLSAPERARARVRSEYPSAAPPR